MPATAFHLIADWSLDAPREAVWRALIAPEQWPSWWRAVAAVERLTDGDTNGVGTVRRMTWRTALPYTLTFDMRTTRVEPMALIEGRPEGMFSGIGRWRLWPEAVAPNDPPGSYQGCSGHSDLPCASHGPGPFITATRAHTLLSGKGKRTP